MLTVLSWVFLVSGFLSLPSALFCVLLVHLLGEPNERTSCEGMKCLPPQDLLTQEGLVTHYGYCFHCLYLVELIVKGPMMQWYFKNEQKRTFMFLWASSRRENPVGRADLLYVVIWGPRSFCSGVLPFARVWSVWAVRGSGWWEKLRRNWCAMF